MHEPEVASVRDGKVSYYCNGENPDCRKRFCYKKGGPCHKTTNILCATSKDSVLAGGGEIDGKS